MSHEDRDTALVGDVRRHVEQLRLARSFLLPPLSDDDTGSFQLAASRLDHAIGVAESLYARLAS